MKKIKYTLLFTCSLSLVGCFESSSLDRWIDNPTTNEINYYYPLNFKNLLSKKR